MPDFITNTADARLIGLGHCARNGGATHAHIEAGGLPKVERAVVPQDPLLDFSSGGHLLKACDHFLFGGFRALLMDSRRTMLKASEGSTLI